MCLMSRLIQLQTSYQPPPSRAEQEREELRELALAALSEDQFDKAFHFLNDVRKLLLVLSGRATLVDC